MATLLETVLQKKPLLRKNIPNELPPELDPRYKTDTGPFKGHEIGSGYAKFGAYYTAPFGLSHALMPSFHHAGKDATKNLTYDNTRPTHRMGVLYNRKFSAPIIATQAGGALAGGLYTYNKLNESANDYLLNKKRLYEDILDKSADWATNWAYDKVGEITPKDIENRRAIMKGATVGALPGLALMTRAGYKTSKQQGYGPIGNTYNAVSLFGGGLFTPRDVGYYDRTYRKGLTKK
jgi:hypothetical protein